MVIINKYYTKISLWDSWFHKKTSKHISVPSWLAH